METKNINNSNQNQKSSWDEYWQKRISDYYATSRYAGD